jgi:uncharacterized protein YjdB
MRKNVISKRVFLLAMCGIVSVFYQQCRKDITIAVTDIMLNESDVLLNIGDTLRLVSTVLPVNASNKEIIWTSDNTDVARVNKNGLVTGESAGIATIIATTCNNSTTAVCTVTVTATPIAVTEIVLIPDTASIEVNKTTPLIAHVLPATATNKKVIWTSDKENIAIVDTNGLVTGKAVGMATITATTDEGGKTATCIVSVTPPSIAVTEIMLTPVTASIEINKTTTIIAHVLPAAATNKKVIWTSDNTNIATVDTKGVVTGKAAGMANIIATTDDAGKTATCMVTVVNPVTSSLVTWYISSSDKIEGLPVGNAQTMKEALSQIKTAKENNRFSNGKKAIIVVNGTITPNTEGALSNNSLVSITGVGTYPPVVLCGLSSGGTLDANNQFRVLYVMNNHVTLADNITLTNGNTDFHKESYGGGVYIEKSTLVMTGGTISHCIALHGGGVFVGEDKQNEHSSFIMTGGTIQDCQTINQSGAGVYIDLSCSFTMSGGFIRDNGTDGKTYTGGGVSVNGNATFTMDGGEISGNKAKQNGGGVSVSGYATFSMKNGLITNNTAPNGSGIFVSKYGGIFTQTGGIVSGNNGKPDIQQ